MYSNQPKYGCTYLFKNTDICPYNVFFFIFKYFQKQNYSIKYNCYLNCTNWLLKIFFFIVQLKIKIIIEIDNFNV